MEISGSPCRGGRSADVLQRRRQGPGSQILDLADAAATGQDKDESRFYGLQVTRHGEGARATPAWWYNWSAAAFVECGLVGAFGGWEPGDNSDRTLVDGDVLVLDADGELATAAAEDIESPVVPLPALTWDDIGDFLWAGQTYE